MCGNGGSPDKGIETAGVGSTEGSELVEMEVARIRALRPHFPARYLHILVVEMEVGRIRALRRGLRRPPPAPDIRRIAAVEMEVARIRALSI